MVNMAVHVYPYNHLTTGPKSNPMPCPHSKPMNENMYDG